MNQHRIVIAATDVSALLVEGQGWATAMGQWLPGQAVALAPDEPLIVACAAAPAPWQLNIEPRPRGLALALSLPAGNSAFKGGQMELSINGEFAESFALDPGQSARFTDLPPEGEFRFHGPDVDLTVSILRRTAGKAEYAAAVSTLVRQGRYDRAEAALASAPPAIRDAPEFRALAGWVRNASAVLPAAPCNGSGKTRSPAAFSAIQKRRMPPIMEEIVDRAVVSLDNGEREQYAEVLRCLDGGEWERAKQALEEMIAENPGALMHRILHAPLAASLGDFHGASDSFDLALARLPNDSMLQAGAGWVGLRLNRPVPAYENLLQALVSDPNNVLAAAELEIAERQLTSSDLEVDEAILRTLDQFWDTLNVSRPPQPLAARDGTSRLPNQERRLIDAFIELLRAIVPQAVDIHYAPPSPGAAAPAMISPPVRVSGTHYIAPLATYTAFFGSFHVFLPEAGPEPDAQDLQHAHSAAVGFAYAISRIRAELAETHRRLGEKIRTVAHDMNKPIVPLALNLRNLKEKVENGKVNTLYVGDKVRSIESALGRLRDILGDILDPQRIERAALEHVDPVELARGIGEFYEPELNRHGIRLVLETAGPCRPIWADTRQIWRVLDNLISNACDAMRPSGGILRLRVREGDNAQQPGIVIEVADTGPGIPPDRVQRIFQPFYTTKPDGLGFGLASCKTIVEKNNGLISVQSAQGQGACFQIWLPVHEDARLSGRIPVSHRAGTERRGSAG